MALSGKPFHETAGWMSGYEGDSMDRTSNVRSMRKSKLVPAHRYISCMQPGQTFSNANCHDVAQERVRHIRVAWRHCDVMLSNIQMHANSLVPFWFVIQRQSTVSAYDDTGQSEVSGSISHLSTFLARSCQAGPGFGCPQGMVLQSPHSAPGMDAMDTVRRRRPLVG